jgi:uncharacterized protein YwgA
MASAAQGQIIFADRAADALLAYLIKTYTEVSRRTLGRTILQKLCYFAKASGVPLPFRFEIYHYGPFSQEIFDSTERLLFDNVIRDTSNDPAQSNYVPSTNVGQLLDRFSKEVEPYEANLRRVAVMFSQLSPLQMELLSTIHYMYSSRREWFNKAPDKNDVVASVLEVKGGKFDKETVEGVYDVLQKSGLLS